MYSLAEIRDFIYRGQVRPLAQYLNQHSIPNLECEYILQHIKTLIQNVQDARHSFNSLAHFVSKSFLQDHTRTFILEVVRSWPSDMRDLNINSVELSDPTLFLYSQVTIQQQYLIWKIYQSDPYDHLHLLLEKFPDLETLKINNDTWRHGELDVGYLRMVSNLKNLIFRIPPTISSVDLSGLKNLSNLENLSITYGVHYGSGRVGGEFTEKNIQDMAQCQNLNCLSLRGEVENFSLNMIRLFPNLKEFRFKPNMQTKEIRIKTSIDFFKVPGV